jgi:hypothetical protein
MDFVQSPHAEADRIVRSNKKIKGDYLVPYHVFLRAVLLCDGLYYDPSRARIPNLFDISTNDAGEHFLLPCLLGLLRRASEQRDGEGYILLEEVFGTFQDVGFEPEQVDFAMCRPGMASCASRYPLTTT